MERCMPLIFLVSSTSSSPLQQSHFAVSLLQTKNYYWLPSQGRCQWWRSPSPWWWPAERWAGQWRQDTPLWCTGNRSQLWSETPERRGRLLSGSSPPLHMGYGWRGGQTLEEGRKNRRSSVWGCKQIIKEHFVPSLNVLPGLSHALSAMQNCIPVCLSSLFSHSQKSTLYFMGPFLQKAWDFFYLIFLSSRFQCAFSKVFENSI